MKGKSILFTIILFMGSLGQVTSDIYLSSLPHIARSLNVSSNWSELSISLFMFGLALSPLIYGPISDGIGRRKPLLFGLVITLIGSVICALANSIEILLLGRFLQGLGAGSTAISRAILRDIYEGDALAKYGSYLMIGGICIMASAPWLGSYIQHFFGWRANFIVLFIYSLITLISIFILLPETNQHIDKNRLKLNVLMTQAKTLLSSKLFMGYAFCQMLTYAGILVWLTAGPVLLQKTFAFSPIEYGWTALAVGLCYGLGAFINAKLVFRVGINIMLVTGLLLMFCSGILLLVNSAPLWVLLSIALYVFATSFVMPNAFSKAFTPFAKLAGTAGALFVAMQITGGMISSAVIAYLDNSSAIPIAVIFMIVSISALMIIKIAESD